MMEKVQQTCVEINTQDIIVKPLLNNNSVDEEAIDLTNDVDEEAIDLTNDEDIIEVKSRKSNNFLIALFPQRYRGVTRMIPVVTTSPPLMPIRLKARKGPRSPRRTTRSTALLIGTTKRMRVCST